MNDKVDHDNIKEEEEDNFIEWVESTFDIRTIRNPHNDLTVMVLLVSGGRAVMGGIRELDDDLQPVFMPLSFAEVPLKMDENTRQVLEIGPKLSKLFLTMEMMSFMMFKPEAIYFMQANKASNMALVGEYEKAVKHMLGEDSNIVITDQMPSPGAVPHLEPVR